MTLYVISSHKLNYTKDNTHITINKTSPQAQLHTQIGQDVCDVSPARDPLEGISFSNEVLWQISLCVLASGILYFSENLIWTGDPLQGDLKQEAYRQSLLSEQGDSRQFQRAASLSEAEHVGFSLPCPGLDLPSWTVFICYKKMYYSIWYYVYTYSMLYYSILCI